MGSRTVRCSIDGTNSVTKNPPSHPKAPPALGSFLPAPTTTLIRRKNTSLAKQEARYSTCMTCGKKRKFCSCSSESARPALAGSPDDVIIIS